MIRLREVSKQEWFNKVCEEAGRKRDLAWNKWKKSGAWNGYKVEGNKYSKGRREDIRNHE